MLEFKLNILLQRCGAERDLVAAQLYLLEHNHLPFSQSDIQFNGHVIEARINAENPERKFQPTPGKVTVTFTTRL